MAVALFAELVGTYLLTFTAGCVSVGAVPAALASAAVGSALMVLVYCTASLSGGHLNPAVSVAVGLAEKMNIPTLVLYVIVQMCGGLAGGFSARHVYGKAVAVGPRQDTDWWEAMIAEVLYTALLCFVVLSVTSKRNHAKHNPNQFYGLAIGSVVTAAGGAIGPISGAMLNPAVTVGLALADPIADHGMASLQWSGCYALFQAGGGALGALLFYLTRPEDFIHGDLYRTYVPSLSTKLIGEFIGTFYLVLTFGLCILLKPVLPDSMIEGPSTPWAMSALIMALIYSLGDVSGGHFNPAVTLSAWLCRKIDLGLITSVLYMVTQVVAGICAALLYAGLCKGRTLPLEPRKPYSEYAAYVLEGIFTAMYCLSVLSTCYAKGIKTPLRRNYYHGLVQGFVFVAGHVACAKVSIGVLNPATAFSVALSHKLNYGDLYYGLSYALAESTGAAVAVMCFVIAYAEAYRPKPVLKPPPAFA